MDWNSFFSSFSGASASLIGVTFAFIISKILNEISDYDSIDNNCRELLLNRGELNYKISELNFSWHDKMIMKYSYHLADLIETKVFSGMNDNQIERYLHINMKRLYFPDSCISFIKNEITNFEEEEKKRKNPLGNGVSIIPPKMKSLNITPPNLWDNINAFEETVNTLEFETNILIKKANNLVTRINGNITDFRLLKNIVLFLLPIITLTVIYPLHFIPLQESKTPQISYSVTNFFLNLYSLKGILLTLLFLIVFFTITYFAHICVTYITKYKRLTNYFDDNFLNIKNYCKIFKARKI